MKLDFADVKPSLVSWVIVGLMASTFIVLAKWLVNKYPIPGVSEVINAV
jgi:riboflavin transporter FmnP